MWSGIKVEGRGRANPAFPVACILEPHLSSSECHMALESPGLKVHSQGGHRYHPWRIIEQQDNDSPPRKEECSAISKEVRNLICLEKVEDQGQFQSVSYTRYTQREREKQFTWIQVQKWKVLWLSGWHRLLLKDQETEILYQSNDQNDIFFTLPPYIIIPHSTPQPTPLPTPPWTNLLFLKRHGLFLWAFLIQTRQNHCHHMSVG